jgi:hypothetical protein
MGSVVIPDERIKLVMQTGLKKLPILPSIEPVVAQSRWVKLHPERLETAIREWGDSLAGRTVWAHPCHYFDGTEETLRWIFVLDVLNHCFWPDVDATTWTVAYKGSNYSGYWGLATSLQRALENGFHITDPAYLGDLSRADLREIFAGEGEIPLIEERLANLREAGRVILSRWHGDLLHLLEETRGSAVQTVRQIVASFPSFRDEAQYRGQQVFFWKRAQLFLADVHGAFSGWGWGRYDDMGELTAFADYKLPQVLRELGIISYHPNLARRIDLRLNLTPGSEEEIEIRAMTIWAVEALKKTFDRLGKTVTSTWVDQWLWQLGQLEPFRKSPYHRCRTIFY